jgi:2-dehydropantoate 2-reductase
MDQLRSTDDEHADESPLVLAGAGAMGRVLAVLLCRCGSTSVTLFTREQTGHTFVEQGELELGGASTAQVPTAAGVGRAGVLGIVSDADQLPDRCGIVFATKGPQLAECIATIADGLARVGQSARWVAGLQNGVVKDDALAASFGAGRVLRTVSTLNARAESPFRADVTGFGHTYVGATGGEDGDAYRFAAALTAAGVPATAIAADRADAAIWMKCVNAVAVFGVTALTRMPTNVAFTRSELADAYLSLAAEVADLAAANGIATADFEGLPMRSRLEAERSDAIATMVTDSLALSEQTPSYSSMAQDVILGQPTEVHEVFGELVRRADAAGVAVPRIRLAYALIAGQRPGPAIGRNSSPGRTGGSGSG